MADLRAIDPEPVGAAVVAYLEDLLIRARDKQFSSIAVALVYRDGTTGSGWSAAPSLPALVGATACLKAKLIRAALGE